MQNEQYKKISIKCNNLSERMAAVSFMERLFGLTLNSNVPINKYIEYLHVQVENTTYYSSITFGLGLDPKFITVPFQDLINYKDYFKPQYKEVKLNETNTAKVYKDKIIVGCQEFPISIISKLNGAHIDLEYEQSKNKS